MKRHVAPLLLTLGLWIAAQQGLADPISFTITTFDAPGSKATEAVGINNASQIVGDYTDSAGNMHGFLDTNGVFTTLDFPGSTFTEATGINNVGQIVGFYSGGAFLYQNGVFSSLNVPASRTLSPIDPFGIPQQVTINDSGQIAGSTINGRAFLYSNGQLTFIPPESSLNPYNVALGLNNAGVVAGSAAFTIGGSGFVYKNGQYTFYGSDESAAYGINNLGHVLVQDFSGTFGGSTYLIANGVVSNLPPIFPFAAFPGIGRSLNDSDQIVGSLNYGQGFLATPVPEPASVLLFTSGLAGLGLLLRRRKRKPAVQNLLCP